MKVVIVGSFLVCIITSFFVTPVFSFYTPRSVLTEEMEVPGGSQTHSLAFHDAAVTRKWRFEE
jgi:hypothetical protein